MRAVEFVRSRWFVTVVVGVVATVGLVLVLGSRGAPSASGDAGEPTVETVASDDSVSPVGEWLSVQEPPDKVPAPSAEAVKQFGEPAARVGISAAEAISFQTSFLSSLWNAEGAPTPEAYSVLLPLMTGNGKATYLSQTASQQAIDQNLVGDFVFTPASDPTVVWSVIPQRPDGNSYKIISTSVGPKSTYNNKPTLKVEFNDYHVYDWTYDGTPVAQEIGRSNVYYLAETGSPENPWLLDEWTSTLLPPIDVEPRVAETAAE